MVIKLELLNKHFSYVILLHFESFQLQMGRTADVSEFVWVERPCMAQEIKGYVLSSFTLYFCLLLFRILIRDAND